MDTDLLDSRFRTRTGRHQGRGSVFAVCKFLYKRILIVDDIVETTHFRLELEGLECLVAYDDEEAALKAKRE